MTKKTEPPPTADPVFIELDGAVATVVINRPDENNAIDSAVREGLLRAFEAIEKDKTIRCVVVVGEGDEAFSVGGDVAQLSTLLPEEAETTARQIVAVQEKILACDRPVIAAIKGACLGLGLDLALLCDLRFARDDARFGLPGVNIGLVPSGGSLELLSGIIGEGQARALALTGGVISAERAFMMGLATNVVSEEDFDESLDELVAHFLSLPAVSMMETKRMLRLTRAGKSREAVAAGIQAFKRCFEEGEALSRLGQLFGGPDPESTVH